VRGQARNRVLSSFSPQCSTTTVAGKNRQMRGMERYSSAARRSIFELKNRTKIAHVSIKIVFRIMRRFGSFFGPQSTRTTPHTHHTTHTPHQTKQKQKNKKVL
jgi:hypothetical protein